MDDLPDDIPINTERAAEFRYSGGGVYIDVYIDVLLLENIIMNYLILLITAKFSKSNMSSIRLFIASVLGASYLLLALAPDMSQYYTGTAKIFLSIVIIVVAFSPEKLKTFIKTLSIFYIVSFLFAGCFVAVSYFADGSGIIANNMVYAWTPKWRSLVYAVLAILIAIRIGWSYIQNRFAKETLLIPLSIVFDKKKVQLMALVDTGNSLHEPISNTPVIVVEFNAVQSILPEEIKMIFSQQKDCDLEAITGILSKSAWISKFRLLPFTSLGKQYGMLIGFKPDYVSIKVDEAEKIFRNVIIGIYNNILSEKEEYSALLCLELVA